MPPARQIVIVDTSPAEEAPWIERACQLAGVKYLGNDPIMEELGKDPEGRKKAQEVAALNDHVPHPELAPYFQKALEKTIAEKKVLATKLALQSVMWLDYGSKAEAAILDLDPLNAQLELGRKSGMKEADVKKYEELFGTRMQATAKKYLSADRILVLPKGASDAQKAELAAAHLKKFVK